MTVINDNLNVSDEWNSHSKFAYIPDRINRRE